ncbi:hypothetical protein EDC94DRAFT_608870 [Helicostylum pulchrum]|nr:hypothetical protein EDC94DRAFT_608870 [Helicostylum pulchrum]
MVSPVKLWFRVSFFGWYDQLKQIYYTTQIRSIGISIERKESSTIIPRFFFLFRIYFFAYMAPVKLKCPENLVTLFFRVFFVCVCLIFQIKNRYAVFF